jgi:ribosome-binding factor A
MKRRLIQIQDLIARELEPIFSRVVEFPLGTFPNISKVKVSPDLHYATVWIGVVPPSGRAAVLKRLGANLADIQRQLNQRLRIKFAPKLQFKVDTTADQVQRINDLVEQIKKENGEP